MSAPLAVDGPAAPPRSNGELLFTAPWESRAFGMAVALYEADAFAWPDFQQALIARIAAWEAAPAGEWSYYAHWLAALEDVLVRTDPALAEALGERAAALATRTPGHDHDEHRSDHGHGH
ncbi:nitrile hydratase accessory protein [Pseudonocardia sp. RS010]|uniref:nitrile hydratase accessory protein n=1 Tax=Pseudonocardia sp. RS010 TaxID=3385979 RepID=UPI0039A18680